MNMNSCVKDWDQLNCPGSRSWEITTFISKSHDNFKRFMMAEAFYRFALGSYSFPGA